MDGHGGPWTVYIGRFLSGKRWKLEGHLSQEKPFLGKENGGTYDVEIL